jgi:hypothetical protein
MRLVYQYSGTLRSTVPLTWSTSRTLILSVQRVFGYIELAFLILLTFVGSLSRPRQFLVVFLNSHVKPPASFCF